VPHGLAFTVSCTLRGDLTLTVFTTHKALLSHSLVHTVGHECRARRYAQSQHPHFPLAPALTHSLACTALFYFVSTKQIPIQACSLSHTCFLQQPHTYPSPQQALTMKSLTFCHLLIFTKCSFSYSLTSSVSGLCTHVFHCHIIPLILAFSELWIVSLAIAPSS